MSSLTRYDPLDDFFRGFFVRPVGYGGDTSELPAIKIDVKAQAQGYQVHAELPGVRKEDIHVDIDGSVVSISAERRQEREIKEGERILRTERHFGKVARSFDLGTEIDEAAASAKYSDGVLELTLPKKAASPNKRLQIQ
ncbi:MAG TPA: Hsp20/alpha crystallin family protein [Rhodocyclaceae bacterium]|nr:Hsp20/alpha crystallin family protein [Rhodocyclaceae bacterium]